MNDSGFIVLIFAVLAFLFSAMFMADRAECHGKWQQSGIVTDWGPVKGCLISLDGKRWIPASNYRETRQALTTEGSRP